MLPLPLVILALESEEERAFMTRLYQEYKQIMYKKALAILRDRDPVEDVIGDACVALLGKISLIRQMDRYTLRAYIVSTIRNTAINHVARRDRQGRYAYLDANGELDDAQSQEPEALGLLIRREEIDRLKRAITGLSDRERLALTMKYLDELPDREIAQALGIKEGSVRPCLMRARRHVYERMKE